MKQDMVVIAVGILFAGAFYRYYKGYRPSGNGNPFAKTASMGVRG